MIKVHERIFLGLCGALFAGGIAMINEQPMMVVIGWAAIGFPVCAMIDVVISYVGF